MKTAIVNFQIEAIKWILATGSFALLCAAIKLIG